MTSSAIGKIPILILILTLSFLLQSCSPESTQLDKVAIESDTSSLDIPLGQLPQSVQPLAYKLELTIVPDQDTFTGRTEIALSISEDREAIWLHGNQLQVESATLTTADGVTSLVSYEQVDSTGVAKLITGSTIPAGEATLVINYTAPFNNSLEGLYRVDEGGKSYAYTQFEATSARLSFPSFDEPVFKVPFDIALTVQENHVAIANTPAVEETLLDNGLKRIQFATTKPLPTYLIAFAVGDLDVVEWADIPTNSVRDVTIPLRGITVKGKGDRIRYALEHSAEIVNALEDYFGIPYPYAKLDILAVPDFSAGAMENAGAITYREQLILIEDTASVSQRRRYASVHAHELAHQWFGNLVTPKWWDDIWLNESFATWMAAKALNNMFPDDGYDIERLQGSLGVMNSDSLVSTRQIRQPILSNHDIATAFDGITYQKGGGVLSMYESFLSSDKFRLGIQQYLQDFKFETATADDFIEAISGTSKSQDQQLIARSFRSFLEQPGIPLLNVETSCDSGVNSELALTLTQNRYFPLGSKGSGQGQQWQIPVCINYGDDNSQNEECFVLQEQSQRIELPKLADNSCPTYVMPNAGGAGYYRWTLSNNGWDELLASVDKLSTSELLSLSNSLDAAFRSGDVDIQTYMNAIPALIASDSWEVAVSPMSNLALMKRYLVNSEQEGKFLSILQQLYADKFAQVGLADDLETSVDNQSSGPEVIRLRSRLVNYLANVAEQTELRGQLTEFAKRYIGYQLDGKLHPEHVDSNLIGTSLRVAVEELGAPFVDALLPLFKASDDATFRGRALSAMSASTVPAVTERMRGLILSDDVRDNEIYNVISRQVNQEETRADMWLWIQSNVDPLVDRIPTWRQGRVASLIGGCTLRERDEINDFFEQRVQDLEGGPRSLTSNLERIELCSALVDAHKDGAFSWLEQN